ncbi:unnamed protein product [Linum trigynum]|uniref:non-specific serine/threonine protein kinase n=1 Tax=Linum trigynum TaxID=586398 RepID=A0AAV2EL24_9ROSI
MRNSSSFLRLVIMILCLSACNPTSYGNSSDLQALLKLKSTVLSRLPPRRYSGFMEWDPKKYNATASEVHCSFYGVTCNSASRVVALEISDRFFGGPIPGEIGLLTHLIRLSINNGRVTAPLPVELPNLTSLEYLDLSRNRLDGSFPAEITRGMTQLRVLDISINRFTGPLPVEISAMKNLTRLYLQGNRFSGKIPESYSALESLKHFELDGNGISGEIPGGFVELPNLEVLLLRGNNLSSELPENLGRNGKLRSIDISSNLLTGFIPRDLCKGGVLDTLILDNNYLTGQLPQELGHCKSLTTIRISNNLLNGTIPAGIFQLPSVNLIKLDNNLFSGQLPSFMWTGELSRLVLSNNRITGRIPPAIGNLTKLESLFLDGNEFSHQIPDEFCNLRFISTVNISSNKITGNIPSCLAKFYYLTVLDLSRNQLCGHIPCSLVNGTRTLRTLDLSHNKLSGRVPKRSPFFHSSFSGNPKLLASSKADCSSKGYSTIVIIGGIGLWLLIWSTLVILVMKMRNQRAVDESIKPWTLINFQKLPEDLKQEDILDCLTEENIIGKGGAGVVYLGSIPGDVKVAIKQPIKRSSQRDNSFAAEVRTLGQIRHKHIVKLLGCVSNSDRSTTLLLYEYMSNGSLAEVLHGPNGGSLSWEMRYKIAVEAAMGLSYLHHDCSPPIIHRDIKPHNILLDSGLEAHIADFGLSKLWHHRRPLPPESSYHMSVVAGTFGYLAPEYAYTLKVDEKIDVYSYGVVMLELISGRKAVGGFDEGVNIVMWVRELASKFVGKTNADVAESVVLEILDPRLVEQPQLASATHMLKIAMMCVDTRSSARPTMREVLHLLTNHQTWNMIISPDHET